jgi:hypothetical protein
VRPASWTSAGGQPDGIYNCYTDHVLRLAAALTLAAFTLLVGVDKLCCPDGCTGKSSTAGASTESVPRNVTHTCVLCVGVDSPDVPLFLEPLSDVSIVAAVLIDWLPGRTLLQPDHPPRNA